MPRDITFVDGDGWEGVYVNGRIICEGQHISVYEFCKIFGLPISWLKPDPKWLKRRLNLPDQLSRVKAAKVPT